MGIKTLFGFSAAIVISAPLTLSVLSRHDHTGEGGRDLFLNTAAALIDNPGRVLERTGYDYVPFIMPPEFTHKVGDRRIPDAGYDWTDTNQKKVQWTPGIKHPDMPNIHADAETGKWNPNIGYVITSLRTLEARWQEGLRYEKLPHMQTAAEEGKHIADPGYTFPEKDKLVAVWTPGVRHSGYPNAVAGARENQWGEAPGYAFREKGKLTTDWVPGWESPAYPHMKGHTKENTWIMSPGYGLAKLENNGIRAVWVPETPSPDKRNVVAGAAEGKWVPADGYGWASTDVADTSVVWKAGVMSRLRANVLTHTDEGSWVAEAGYNLHKDSSGNLYAARIPDPATPAESNAMDDCVSGAKTGVKIAVVTAGLACLFDVATLGTVTGGTACFGGVTAAKVAAATAGVVIAGCAGGLVLGSPQPSPTQPGGNQTHYTQQPRVFSNPGPR